MNRNLQILIIVAVCNDGITLSAVTKSALATGYDVLVIDDGSLDNCLQSIADLQCRRLRFKAPKGKREVLLKGAEYAAKFGYDTIVTILGDGRHNPADIHLLVAKAEKYKTPCLIIGMRQRITDTVSKYQHNENSFSDFWIRLECGLELLDAESSFRLYPVKELLAQTLTRNDCSLEIETVVKLAWSGIPVNSVPVTCCTPTVSKLASHSHKIKNNLSLASLHSQLLLRRLLPWPHKKLTNSEPFPKKVYETVSRNPLKVLRKICSEHTSPLWLAMAVWLGIFMGALPLLAIHTIAIIYVAHKLHFNKVAAVAASQFCMPPIVPVLCIQIGHYLRTGQLLVDFSWQPWLLGIHERLWEWLLGSLLLGPLLGLVGGVIMHWMAVRLQHRKEIIPPTIG
jgi:uncharacterized protein (DUF2062 family)